MIAWLSVSSRAYTQLDTLASLAGRILSQASHSKDDISNFPLSFVLQDLNATAYTLRNPIWYVIYDPYPFWLKFKLSCIKVELSSRVRKAANLCASFDFTRLPNYPDHHVCSILDSVRKILCIFCGVHHAVYAVYIQRDIFTLPYFNACCYLCGSCFMCTPVYVHTLVVDGRCAALSRCDEHQGRKTKHV